MAKPTLAVDFDDVLFDYCGQLVAYHNHHYQTAYRVDDIFSYHFGDVWGDPVERVIEKLDHFYSTGFFTLPPVEGAIGGIEKLGRTYDLAVVTSRHERLKPHTKRHLDTHFAGHFREVHFAHNPYAGFGVKSKAQICVELGATALIDDALEHAQACNQAGIVCYLLDRPWNQALTVDGIIRVDSWSDIVAKLSV